MKALHSRLFKWHPRTFVSSAVETPCHNTQVDGISTSLDANGAWDYKTLAIRATLSLTTLALVTGCGNRGDLEPLTGQKLPSAQYGAATPAGPADLMTPDSQAVPIRSDELLRRSEKRDDDGFDIPPPG